MKILLISNMYPSPKYPAYGVFVKNFVDICEENEINTEKIIMHKNNTKMGKILNYFIYYIKIFSAILLNHYDIVYVHYGGQNSFPLYFLTKLKKVKIILNLHGSDVFPENNIHKFFLFFTKKLIKECYKVVVPSNYFKAISMELFGVGENELIVFPSSGVNQEIFYPKDKLVAKRKFGFDEKTHLIGYVGRIEHGKGWDTLLESIKILDENGFINPDYHKFIFIGDGKETDRFLKKIEELSIGKYIYRVSSIPQTELCDYYNAFDVFCFPTKRKSESLGLVGIESLACGTPVIASDFAAPKYYIEDAYNGYKFEVNSADNLSTCITKILNLNVHDKEAMIRNSLESSLPYRKKNISKKLIKEVLAT